MKGREILAGKKIETTAEIPSGITLFQEALEKHYMARCLSGQVLTEMIE